MKKFLGSTLVVLLLSTGLFASGYKFYFDLSGSYMASPDATFRGFYGEDAFFPELAAGIKIYRDLFVWAGYGFFTAKGAQGFSREGVKARQSYLSGGIGYRRLLSEDFGIKLTLGLMQAGFKETGNDIDISSTTLGFRADGGLIMYFGRAYIELSNGYLYARDTVGDWKIRLGGYRVGLAIGFQF